MVVLIKYMSYICGNLIFSSSSQWINYKMNYTHFVKYMLVEQIK